MVEAWRGKPLVDVERRQREFFAALLPSEFSKLPTMDIAAVKLHAEDSGNWPHSIDANAVTWLKQMVQGKCAIITCLAEPTGRVMANRSLVSPFGQPHSNDLPHHAIVVLARDSEIVAHDPWFEADGQPVSLSNRDVVQMWTGYVALFGHLPAS